MREIRTEYIRLFLIGEFVREARWVGCGKRELDKRLATLEHYKGVVLLERYRGVFLRNRVKVGIGWGDVDYEIRRGKGGGVKHERCSAG